MSLDDLLGLLFLLVFVVGPVLKGLLKGSQEAPLLEVELPEPPSEAEAPPPPPAEPRRPRVRPVAVAPAEVEAAPEPEPAPAEAAPKARRTGGLKLRFDRGGILEGVVWHEILSEPRARRRWKPKR
ncbi:MAG TPA: hypothetical protein ENJ76_03515 [Oceanithermus sp.]|nr:hypothetical protein [Oceanithermus sp.]